MSEFMNMEVEMGNQPNSVMGRELYYDSETWNPILDLNLLLTDGSGLFNWFLLSCSLVT